MNGGISYTWLIEIFPYTERSSWILSGCFFRYSFFMAQMMVCALFLMTFVFELGNIFGGNPSRFYNGGDGDIHVQQILGDFQVA